MQHAGVTNQWAAESRFPAQELWCCPACRGSLAALSDELIQCNACHMEYPAVDGIPDLRVRDGSSTYADEDLEQARQLSAACRGKSLEEVMHHLCDRPENDDATRALRVRQIMESPGRLNSMFEGWLQPCLSRSELFLDVGCGSGGLLAQAAVLGYPAAGIDASMAMLVAARHMIEGHGGVALLAAAWGEKLPVASGRLAGVTLYDSIEHVADVRQTISEASRVLRAGGGLAMSTPNRFSLAAEPHVFVWGVGWLPRKWQNDFVKWRSGLDYSDTELLSTWEMARTLARHAELEFELIAPQVPEEEIAHFTPRRAFLANTYNRIARFRLSRPLLLAVGPFFQVVARRLAA